MNQNCTRKPTTVTDSLSVEFKRTSVVRKGSRKLAPHDKGAGMVRMVPATAR